MWTAAPEVLCRACAVLRLLGPSRLAPAHPGALLGPRRRALVHTLTAHSSLTSTGMLMISTCCAGAQRQVVASEGAPRQRPCRAARWQTCQMRWMECQRYQGRCSCYLCRCVRLRLQGSSFGTTR